MQDKNIRMRLLAVQQILLKTEQPVSVQDIIFMINRQFNLMIPVSDRRAVYNDIKAIKDSGMPISVIKRRSNKHYYYLEGIND